MLENLNGWEVIVLALLGLFIFGPERLPKVIGDAMRTIRNLRDMARNATNDLSREMGTDVRLEDLHPKTFIRKHLLSEEDERALRKPFDEMYQDVHQISTEVSDAGRSVVAPAPRSYDERPNGASTGTSSGGGAAATSMNGVTSGSSGSGIPSGAAATGGAAAGGAPTGEIERPGAGRYDADAT